MCDGAIIKRKPLKITDLRKKLMRLQYEIPEEKDGEKEREKEKKGEKEKVEQIKPKLKYVNCGAGTTGTRSLFRLFCSHWKVESLHYAIDCHLPPTKQSDHDSLPPLSTLPAVRNKLLMWYNHLTKCAVNPRNNCTSYEILSSLQSRLPSILSEYEFLSDTPIDMLFLEIYAAMRFQIRVFATLRQPMNWASRRVEEHPNTLICRPELWNQTTVFHPFDILGCLSMKTKVEEALTTVFELIYSQPWKSSYRQRDIFQTYGQPSNGSLSTLASAYVTMNTVHNDIVQLVEGKKSKGITQICLWDTAHDAEKDPDSSNSNLTNTFRIESSIIHRIQHEIIDRTISSRSFHSSHSAHSSHHSSGNGASVSVTPPPLPISSSSQLRRLTEENYLPDFPLPFPVETTFMSQCFSLLGIVFLSLVVVGILAMLRMRASTRENKRDSLTRSPSLSRK